MRPCIVVIDGSMTVRKILEMTFERAGWLVYTFVNGKQALTALKREDIPVPEAIVLDVRLPKMNGYAVARSFRRQECCRHCVILFLSAQDGLFDRLRRRLAGGTASMTKPFKAEEVLWTLSASLRQPSEASARS